MGESGSGKTTTAQAVIGLLAELRALRAELTELKAINAAAARHAHETSRTLSLVTNFGTAMLTEPSA